MKIRLRRALKQIRDEIENSKLLTTTLHEQLHGAGSLHDTAFRAERSTHRALDGLNDMLGALRGEAGDEQLTMRFA